MRFLPVGPLLGRIKRDFQTSQEACLTNLLVLPSHVADASSAILDPVLRVQERGVTKHDRFNTRNNFKRICVCGGEGGRQRGCRPCSTLDADQWASNGRRAWS
jgi:hypothetical protein